MVQPQHLLSTHASRPGITISPSCPGKLQLKSTVQISVHRWISKTSEKMNFINFSNLVSLHNNKLKATLKSDITMINLTTALETTTTL